MHTCKYTCKALAIVRLTKNRMTYTIFPHRLFCFLFLFSCSVELLTFWHSVPTTIPPSFSWSSIYLAFIWCIFISPELKNNCNNVRSHSKCILPPPTSRAAAHGNSPVDIPFLYLHLVLLHKVLAFTHTYTHSFYGQYLNILFVCMLIIVSLFLLFVFIFLLTDHNNNFSH